MDSSYEFYSSKYLNSTSQRQIKANWNPHESSSWLSCKFQWNVKMFAENKVAPPAEGATHLHIWEGCGVLDTN